MLRVYNSIAEIKLKLLTVLCMYIQRRTKQATANETKQIAYLAIANDMTLELPHCALRTSSFITVIPTLSNST